MRSQPTLEQRREVEALAISLPGGRPGDHAFDEPWQLRAFALAVAAHKAGQFEWSDFQNALIESIKNWESAVNDLSDSSWSYYEHWVNALECLLSELGAVDSTTLDGKTQEVLATPPNRNHHEPHHDPVAVDRAR